MAKFKNHVAGEGGWSEWDAPVLDGYKMACCDCGLVHTMEFKIGRIVKRYSDGSYDLELQDKDEFRVVMRAKRNNRSTAQMRRHMKGNKND